MLPPARPLLALQALTWWSAGPQDGCVQTAAMRQQSEIGVVQGSEKAAEQPLDVVQGLVQGPPRGAHGAARRPARSARHTRRVQHTVRVPLGLELPLELQPLLGLAVLADRGQPEVDRVCHPGRRARVHRPQHAHRPLQPAVHHAALPAQLAEFAVQGSPSALKAARGEHLGRVRAEFWEPGVALSCLWAALCACMITTISLTDI